MANMSDPRVPRVLAHAEACRQSVNQGKDRPDLPKDLRDLSNIDLTVAVLSWTNLSGANLKDATLYKADLLLVDLSGADLRGANLEGAYLRLANLSGADLRGADLSGANLGFADLTDAKITQDQLNSAEHGDVAISGYPQTIAEKVILFGEPEPKPYKRKAKKRLVVELRADGKLHIKTPIFKY